jgi:hypothetical protein
MKKHVKRNISMEGESPMKEAFPLSILSLGKISPEFGGIHMRRDLLWRVHRSVTGQKKTGRKTR